MQQCKEHKLSTVINIIASKLIRKHYCDKNYINNFSTYLKPEAFPQRVFRLTPGNTGLPSVGFFVSLTATCVTRCYPVAIASLTPEKVGLPWSELP